MAIEIERKFLVSGDAWRAVAGEGKRILQGYLSLPDGPTVRVRVYGEHAYLTIKGASDGISRAEFEYPIPVADAVTMLEGLAVSPLIDKVRYRVPCGGHVWDLDVFAGENAGLVLAEVELGRVDEPFVRPDWAGTEVSDDARYYNANLARHPVARW